MEIHHHPHTETTHAGKRFKHYLFEFFMLFLAVFCGFLAENFREHQVEHKQEKKLVAGMLEDLKRDTVYLDFCVTQYIPNHFKWMDSAIRLLEQPGHEKDRETYQAYLIATEWNYNYFPTERTLSQLRSYGYRLIRNSRVGDLLSELEIMYKVYLDVNDHVHAMQNDIDESAYVFADKKIVSNLFISQYPFPNDVFIDLKEIPESASVNKASPDFSGFINKLKKYNYYLVTSLKGDYLRLIKFQRSAINLIKNEYHLQ